jgi:VanZ family protein
MSHEIARVGTTSVLLFILIALRFGRSLEKSFPILVRYIPHVGGAIFTLCAITLLITARKTTRSNDTSSQLSLPFLLKVSVWLIISVLACYLLIDTQIEVIHFVKYAILCACLSFSQRSGTLVSRSWRACLVTVLLGTIEETAQLWVPMRVFDLRDIALNVSGAFSGLYFSLVAGRLLSHDRGS